MQGGMTCNNFYLYPPLNVCHIIVMVRIRIWRIHNILPDPDTKPIRPFIHMGKIFAYTFGGDICNNKKYVMSMTPRIHHVFLKNNFIGIFRIFSTLLRTGSDCVGWDSNLGCCSIQLGHTPQLLRIQQSTCFL